ncbi:MAG: hypothetical protein KAS63_10905 [Candidatus Heimdallarchaeota archaeon]|nr:hypothetical protein [Candidatus Heimdallarchaeota archaeon]MCK4955865.1 hypothetical protein [Candidatus Heimdallarchaeota archaeon]
MSKIDILPPLLARIGFNETDIKVYAATLGLGKVTIGELLVVTGLDPLTLIQSVKNLEELGFLKKTAGRTPEYFGMLPFLKEYIVVEKDALYSLDGVITALKSAKEGYQEKKTKFGGTLELTEEGHVFDIHVVSGLIKQVVDALYQKYLEHSEQTEDSASSFIEESRSDIEGYLTKIMDQPLVFSAQLETYVEELNAFIKQFHHTAKLQSDQLVSSINEKTNQTFENLKQILGNGLDSHTDNHKEFLDKLAPELDNELKELIGQVTEIQEAFSESYNKVWQEAYSSWTNESKNIVEELSQEVNNLFTDQIKQTQELRRSVEQIDRQTNFLSSKIAEALNSIETSAVLKLGKARKQIESPLTDARDTVRNLANDLNESGLQLIDQHVLALNTVRDEIRSKLDHFQLSGETSIRTKKNQLTDVAIEKIDLLPSNLLELIQDETEKYALSAYESCSEVTNQLKQTTDEEISTTKNEVLKEIQSYFAEQTQVIQKLQNEVIKELSKSRLDSEKTALSLKEKIQLSVTQFKKKIQDKQGIFAQDLTELKQNLKDYRDEQKDQIVQQVTEGEEIQINALVSQVAAVIKDVDEIIATQIESLLEKAMTFYQVINTREDELKQIERASSSYSFEGQHSTSIIVGEEAIRASITDIAMRSKFELLMVTPDVDEELMKEMMQYTKAQRITLVSYFDKSKHQTILRPLMERFPGLKLKHYEKKDVYCGILDGANEAIFAFLTADSVPIAVRTTNDLLLGLFKSAINRDVLFHANDFEI